jgi:aspartate aminotransferase
MEADMISHQIAEQMSRGSLIRKMFEEGNRLKQQYGADQVFDFSLGNPDLEPPNEVQQALKDLVNNPEPGLHAYMSNAGLLSVRETVARHHSNMSGLAVEASDICMTVGAAGALNVMLKALLDPGDEVIVLAPFFFEYLSYTNNHGGQTVVVKNNPQTLLPDLDAIERAITPRTKALIINSPNNPSGVIYPRETLLALDVLLRSREQVIYVLSDEPYADLVYDGNTMPSTLACIQNAVICTSWSKQLSLPGERIGSIVISPRCEDRELLSQSATYCNRILGYVNAPALFQRVIERAIDAVVAIDQYEKRRDMLFTVLGDAGWTVEKPAGGLYLFPRSPIDDDTAFANACARHRILLVPGSAFWFPGYVRLCFAVSEQTIRNSAKAFQAVAREFSLS